MKRIYIKPFVHVICDVCEPIMVTGSNDIESTDNNNQNGGGTLNSPGIDYGPDWTGGNLNEGDLE